MAVRKVLALVALAVVLAGGAAGVAAAAIGIAFVLSLFDAAVGHIDRLAGQHLRASGPSIKRGGAQDPDGR